MDNRMTSRRYLPNTLALFAVLMLGLMSPAQAQTMDTPATHAIILDAETGVVLFEKDAAAPFSPASMSKLMTVYLAFELIGEGSSRL